MFAIFNQVSTLLPHEVCISCLATASHYQRNLNQTAAFIPCFQIFCLVNYLILVVFFLYIFLKLLRKISYLLFFLLLSLPRIKFLLLCQRGMIIKPNHILLVEQGARQLYASHLRPFLLKHQARLDLIVEFVYGEMVRSCFHFCWKYIVLCGLIFQLGVIFLAVRVEGLSELT